MTTLIIINPSDKLYKRLHNIPVNDVLIDDKFFEEILPLLSPVKALHEITPSKKKNPMSKRKST